MPNASPHMQFHLVEERRIDVGICNLDSCIAPIDTSSPRVVPGRVTRIVQPPIPPLDVGFSDLHVELQPLKVPAALARRHVGWPNWPNQLRHKEPLLY